MTAILGISAYFHDSAAALVVDGRIVGAAQEERFTRRKHDEDFPEHAIAWLLDSAGLRVDELDHVVFYDKPFLKFERLLETYVASVPRGLKSFSTAIPVWLREKLFLKDLLLKRLKKLDRGQMDSDRMLFTEHHMSHAASAFYPSPFEEAVVLTLDGVGEWATTTVAIGRGKALDIVREIRFPHSLGLLYSAFTYYLGFKVNSGEYKVMGLAPYGVPRFKDLILTRLVDVRPDGSYWLDQEYFNYATGLTMTNARFDALFGQPRRKPESDLLTQFHMDVAASLQAALEEIVLVMTRAVADEFAIPNLCLAGGVALNCVANGKILRDGRFKDIWVQPASGDAGGALGAALAVWHQHLDHPRTPEPGDSMRGAYLGPSHAQADIEAALRAAGAVFETVTDDDLIAETAAALADGKAVGWFQGAMEFGPRALGARSILGDPRASDMQKTLNLKVKFRESFRPFAPAILAEEVGNWFEHTGPSPYMLMVADVIDRHRLPMSAEQEALFGIDKLNVPRSSIPAVTHVDYSARIQTVHRETNPRFHALISAFRDHTGVPVLVNTSFNVRGEPIVNTPADAFRCFMGTGIDWLVVGNCILRKEAQTVAATSDYRDQYELD